MKTAKAKEGTQNRRVCDCGRSNVKPRPTSPTSDRDRETDRQTDRQTDRRRRQQQQQHSVAVFVQALRCHMSMPQCLAGGRSWLTAPFASPRGPQLPRETSASRCSRPVIPRMEASRRKLAETEGARDRGEETSTHTNMDSRTSISTSTHIWVLVLVLVLVSILM